ncbi:MAG: cytochrome c oxidase assembly protein [Chloroflexi bacterium]|nr:cytochrome c oxidase assembly protein [Chloroflexota bacterium]MCI0580121.1 cytochrome c oxidase assembly protein [Chloroflexota bacterium]MCI0649303.1 cytochrome c oxidase assembly protein [Chloroflexota bacterium]MCI0725964.1 cytochrome c oxidase assembly protein [Chloroflexota bacterium]
MDPVLRAFLASWDWRIDVILVLVTAGTLYLTGWLRLRRRAAGKERHSQWQMAAGWRPVAYLGGLTLLALALMSPLDVLGSQLFFLHMIQHLVMIMLVPPLLLLANPLPFFLWGLPASLRPKVGGPLFGRASPFRYGLRQFTGPALVWFLFVACLWGWHEPMAYNAAQDDGLVHDLEHITFFGTSLLFWWHVVGAGPRVHRPFSAIGRIIYLASAIPPSMVAGVVIAFARTPIYSHYEAMPRLWGISVLSDQQLAGIMMWVPGGLIYIVAILILAGRWLQREQEKPALPESAWATDEALIAPGINFDAKAQRHKG